MVLYFSLSHLSSDVSLIPDLSLISDLFIRTLQQARVVLARRYARARKPARDPAAHSNTNSQRADCHTAARRDLDWTRREGCDRNHVRQCARAKHFLDQSHIVNLKGKGR